MSDAILATIVMLALAGTVVAVIVAVDNGLVLVRTKITVATAVIR